jgi:hypothetical protein
MRCDLFVVAESAAIDVQTNRLSIFHIWDAVNATTFPSLVPVVAIVAMFTREASEPSEVELEIGGSLNGQTIAQLPVTVTFQNEVLKTRLIINVQGMVFAEQGACEITIRRGEDEPLAVWRVQVNLIAQPQIQAVEAVPATRR